MKTRKIRETRNSCLHLIQWAGVVLMILGLSPFSVFAAANFAELCRKGTLEQVRKALVSADIEERDEDGYTPLMCALGGGRGAEQHVPNPDPEVARFLIASGANVNAAVKDPGIDLEERSTDIIFTPLHLAVMRQPSLVPDLLNAGSDVNALSIMGTPLIQALKQANERPELYKLLLRRGADVNREVPPWGTAFSAALWLGGSTVEAIDSLLDAGGDIRYVDSFGNTVLMRAVNGAGRNSVDLLQKFPEGGVDVNAANEEGQTAFLLAVQSGASADTLRFLLRSGANAGAVDRRGRTIWHYAVDRGEMDRDTLEILKNSGVSIDRRDEMGISPLMWAAYSASPATVKSLIEAGADTKIKDHDGYTAYSYARGAYRQWQENADMIFFRGSRIRIYLARGLYVIFLTIPVWGMVGVFVLRFVQHKDIHWRVLVANVLFVFTVTIFPLVWGPTRTLPLDRRLRSVSLLLSIWFLTATLAEWRKKSLPAKGPLFLRLGVLTMTAGTFLWLRML